MRALPIEPLLRTLRLDGADTVLEISERFGLHRHRLTRDIADGRISVTAADRIAIRIGLHPILIWGDQWLDPVAYRMGRIDAAFEQLRQEVAS